MRFWSITEIKLDPMPIETCQGCGCCVEAGETCDVCGTAVDAEGSHEIVVEDIHE